MHPLFTFSRGLLAKLRSNGKSAVTIRDKKLNIPRENNISTFATPPKNLKNPQFIFGNKSSIQLVVGHVASDAKGTNSNSH
jgi:hypothetical protein